MIAFCTIKSTLLLGLNAQSALASKSLDCSRSSCSAIQSAIALRIFPGYKVAVYVSVILFESIMTFSTYYGIRAITRLSYIAVPVILVLGCAIILYAIINEKTNILYKFGNGESISVIEGIQVVIGTYISGAKGAFHLT